MQDTPYGYCQCGCGELAPIAAKTDRRKGWVEGEPKRFVYRHSTRTGSTQRKAADLALVEGSGIPLGVCQCGCGEATELAPYTSRAKHWVKDQPKRYRRGHATQGKRFGEDPRGRYVEEDRGHDTPCWVWQGALSGGGYGQFWSGGKDGHLFTAHRWFYEEAYGAIPAGLQLDHLCRVRACVNPTHLEPVTNAENSRRGDMAKLTYEAVAEIRRLAAAGHTAKELAERYGVGHSTACSAINGKTWTAE